MEKKSWYRESAAGIGKIYYWTIQDETIKKKKGIIQLVHGMMGNSSAYNSFAAELAGMGYVVALSDLQGHGKSASMPGYFGPKHGFDYITHDMHRLTLQMKRWYPDLPVIMFGHSMGSILTRLYASKFPDDIDAMILSGTIGSGFNYYAALAVMAAERKMHGDRSCIDSYDSLMVSIFNKSIPDPVNAFAWCSTDPEVCKEHVSRSGNVRFTVAGYYDLIKGIIDTGSTKWAAQVPDIPVYIFSGGSDPCGKYGLGPTEVWAWLKTTGHNDCTLKLYPGKRHEMLNETNREEVKAHLYKWMEEKIKCQ